MLERLLISIALSAGGWLLYRALTTYLLARQANGGLQLEGYIPGRPAILYFTAPGCVPCETLQGPALAELEALSQGRLQVIEVDASLQPHLADSWGVLSVPTTFIIDSQGRPRGVNQGVARARKLAGQLAGIGEFSPEVLDPSHVPGTE